MGRRNVQGIAFSATSGAAGTIEHGADRDGEVKAMLQGDSAGIRCPGGDRARIAAIVEPGRLRAVPR